ncbi:MAG: hypothetical protein AB8H03_16645 [Saprospiraceae bacterium]
MNHFIKICYTTFFIFLLFGNTTIKAQPYLYTWNQLSLDVTPFPLDLRVGYYGDIQIWRDGNSDGQLYNPTRGANNTCGNCDQMYNGLFMNVGSNTYVTWSAALDGFTDYFDGGVSDITGSGTTLDPWRIAAEFYDFSDTYGFQMVYYYVDGNEYFDVEMTPVVSATNTQVVKVYHILDTYLGSSDFGPAYTSGAAPYNVVGVEASDGSIFEAFVMTEDPWDRYASHFYYDLINEPFNDTELSNTLDFDPTTDNAIGVQWTLGVVTGTQPTIRYRIGFTDDITTIVNTCDQIYMNRHISRFIKAN